MSIIDCKTAIELLRQGDVVGLPTETVYGLGARIDSDSALHKIFAVKQRPFFDPLIVHVTDVASARALCSEWPGIFATLCTAFWPGPLTVIAPKRPEVSSLITSGLETVALRCPQHPLMLEVLHGLGVPIAAPSANRFGRTSPTTAQHVEQEFSGRVPVVDGGPCTIGVESTVLTATEIGGEWQVKILRPGGVSRAQIRAALDRTGVRYKLTRENSSASPGHLKAHYQPVSPVILLREKSWSSEVLTEVERKLGRTLKGAQEIQLPEAPQQAARELYDLFRRLSSDGDHALWIRQTAARSGEDWEAIWDRVERASCVAL